ncbi:MAG: EamA family transporter [Candidatus Peribacteria bacterium]|nr:MAG: EamA family transporter [Candidatus Peribacteria bacterium]
METWLLFAILSAVTAGIHNFTMKVISERKYNTSLVTTYAYTISSTLFFISIFFSEQGFKMLSSELIPVMLLALASTVFYFFSVLSRVESMRCIHTVIFYPIYKTFAPILATIAGLWYFGESLTLQDWVGIIIGILIPLLLITRAESYIQKNLMRGVVFAMITVVFGILAVIPAKQAHVIDANINVFLLFACLF